jgi:NAD(P)-dependent dehydrogenase (short-subunit alcohol dehydrogenase family)
MNEVKYKAAILKGAELEIDRLKAIGSTEEGADVAVTDDPKSQGSGIADAIRNAEGENEFHHLRVTDEAELTSMITEIAEPWGRIVVL